MSRLIVLAFAFLLSACATSPVLAIDRNQLVPQVLGPSLQLNRDCSAVAIYSDRDKESGKVETVFLTAKHCVENRDGVTHLLYQPIYDVRNRMIEERAVRAKVRGTFFKHDLALLQSLDEDRIFKPVAKVAKADVTILQTADVFAVGYPLGQQLTITEGLFTSRWSLVPPGSKKELEYFHASPSISGGNSGGGLFMPVGDDFYLIGVASLGAKGNPHMGFYVPIDAIRDYIDVALTKRVP